MKSQRYCFFEILERYNSRSSEFTVFGNWLILRQFGIIVSLHLGF